VTSSFLELTRTRLRLFFREPSAMFWTFGFPILLSFGLGIAFRNRPPEPVTIAVSEGGDAKRLFDALAQRPDVKPSLLSPEDARHALRIGKVALIVLAGPPREYVYDPMRPDSRLARALVDEALQEADGRHNPTVVADTHVTELGSRYIDFLIPGLIGVNLMSSGLWGIGWVIVEMRTQRLLRRFMATPMKRSYFLASFVVMRMLFLLLEIPVLLVFAWLTFNVQVRGSLPLFVLVTALGAIAFAGIGLLVASRARNTQTAGGLMNVVMLPMYILSGVFFSSANFPDILQPIIKALPLTALNSALRAVMNEGAGPSAIAGQLAVLVVITVLSFGVALRIFRWE
jgi:ABC-type multidrug transport system permease subunit